MRYSQTFLDDLLARTDIVSIIGKRLALKKKGANHSACCPFHHEKTASFTVSETKQFYHCFGCGANGSALKFLMEYDRLSFHEAIALLAHEAGMALPESTPRSAEQIASQTKADQEKQNTFDLTAQALAFYAKQFRALFQSPDARQNPYAQYMVSRGLNARVVNDYGIGFAPEGWDNLLKNFPNQTKILLNAGLVIQNDQGRHYDRFRQRLLFPIRDIKGRVIGFGGRAFGDEQPKYLNSPETVLFQKGHNLYGLYEAKKANPQLTRLILVEGYMDVVSLAKAEMPYAIATSGTATTTEQIQLAFRHARELIFCFDGDKAGKGAAQKALERVIPLMKSGREVKFLFLPDGEDPDSLVRKEGKAAFEARMGAADSYIQYLYQECVAQGNPRTLDGRAKILEAARVWLGKMAHLPEVKTILAGQFARCLGVNESALDGNTMPLAPAMPPASVTSTTKKPHKPHKPKSAFNALSRPQRALRLLLKKPSLAESVPEHFTPYYSPELADSGLAVLFQAIDYFREHPQHHAGHLLENLKSESALCAWVLETMNDEVLLPEAGIDAEWSDWLQYWQVAQDNARLDFLYQEAKTGNLSTEFMQEMMVLLRKNKIYREAA